MLSSYLLYLSLAAFLVVQIDRVITVVGANIHDARFRTKPRSNKKGRLSIVVVTHNDAECIEEWLDALLATIGRQRIPVIIIDNASGDATPRLLRQYARTHKRVAVSAKRKYITTNQVYKVASSVVKGQHVLLLNTELSISRQALANLRLTLGDSDAAHVVQPGREVHIRPSFAVMLQQFVLLAGTQRAKVASLLGPGRHVGIGEPGSAYRHDLFSLLPGFSRLVPAQVVSAKLSSRAVERHNRLVTFAPHITLAESPIASPLQLVRDDRQRVRYGKSRILIPVLNTIEAFSLTYFFYLAYTGATATLFYVSWLAFIVWGGLLVGGSVLAGPRHKLLFYSVLPILFFLHYIQLFGRGVVVLLSIARSVVAGLNHSKLSSGLRPLDS